MSTIQMADPIYFGGVDLNTITGWRTTGTDPFRYPERLVNAYSLAYSNQSTTTSAFFTGKKINVRGVIARSGRELLDDSLSEMRRILDPKNQTLQLPISGNQRIFNEVTVGNIAIANVMGGYAEVDIEFIASEPYNYGLTSSSVLGVINLTSGDKSYPVIFDGTASQEPTITYTLDSYSGSGNKSVSFSNPLTVQTLTVTRTWTATDLLVIDCRSKTVVVNGTAVTFTGNFPEWSPGNGFVNYADGFTSRQVDISVTYTKRYL